MTLPVEVNPLLTGGGGYNVSRSVRLRSSASAYLNRTVTTSGSGQKFTWSGWVKRGSNTASDDQWIFSTNSFVTSGIPPYLMEITFKGAGSGVVDKLSVVYESNAGAGGSYQTTAVYRDFAAWYHIVVAVDTTQATAGNRTLIYVNGQQVTSFYSATPVAQNTILAVNQTGNIQTIGALNLNGSPSRWFDGYITEVNFIDGQALTPSSFGGYNSVTGGWEARKYTGTYGTNGFCLNFSDNSAATAAAIGKDSSGNGNNWTPNNISLTAGVTYDSMLDVPTMWADGGNGRGNYATLNPIFSPAYGGNVLNANLDINSPTTDGWIPGTIAVSSGKWYYEATMTNAAAAGFIFGIAKTTATASSTEMRNGGTGNIYSYLSVTGVKSDGSGGAGTAYGATFTTGDIMGCAFDLDNGTIAFYKNNISQGTAYSGVSGLFMPAVGDALSGSGGQTASINFGQRPFSYTPPSGFKALHTGNLPAPAITNPNKNFDVSLYTGNSATQSITNAGGFAPDLVWLKARTDIAHHRWLDTVRGSGLSVYSSSTIAEQNETSYFTSFNSTGFSLGPDVGGAYNYNGSNYAAWQWKAGGTAVSNTAGTITSQVSANASAGFSVVTYTGTGVNGATIGHGLGVAPKMMIVKGRNNVVGWSVYHSSIGATAELLLNSTAAAATHINYWNNTSPTSSVFSIGVDGGVNNSTWTYVAYCFSEIAGYSKMGSYIGNGSADGPFVYTGFRPKFIMFKEASGTNAASSSWIIHDTGRNTSNLSTRHLRANSTSIEDAGANESIDILSNGFKCRGAVGNSNESGGTYIYYAIAETPFKNALAR